MITISSPNPSGPGTPSTKRGGDKGQQKPIRYRPSLPWEENEPVVSPSEFPSVSDFVFKSLNRRFLGYYDSLMTLTTSLEVDEFDARAIVRDTNKEEAAQIFEAYRSYAPFCRTSLVNAILMWRSQQHSKKTEWSDFFTENSHPKLQGKDSWGILEEKKLLLVNYLWAKITFIVLRDRHDGEQLETQTAVRVLDVCFSMLTGQTSKLRCFDSNFNVFIKIVAEILSILSSTLAVSCIDRSITEMDKLDPNKNTTDYLNLLVGVKALSLNVYDSRSSSEVMKLFHKLSNLINLKQKVKMPDSVRGALFDTFANLLSSVTANTPKVILANFASNASSSISPSFSSSGLSSQLEGGEGEGPSAPTPPSLLSDLPGGWYPLMDDLYTRLSSMVKKGKNLTWCLPLSGVVLCCCRKESISGALDTYMDAVFRYFKPGDKLRMVALESIFRLLHTAFVWLEDEDEITDRICRRVAKEFTQGNTKARAPPQEEIVSYFVDIITLISLKKFDFATKEIVLVLLKTGDREAKTADINCEKVIVGLLSAKAICSLLGVSSDAHLGLGGGKTKKVFEQNIDAPTFRKRAISQFRRDETTLSNPDTLLYGCGGALDYYLPILDSQFGSFLATLQTKPIADLVPTSKMPLLELFETCLSCLSFCLPTKMEAHVLVVIVWRCTLHLHEPIKKLSLGNLRDFIEHRPLIRSTVINQFGTFIRGIKDECIEHLLSSLGLFSSLLSQWYTLACTEVPNHHQVDGGPKINVIEVESTMLMLLCRCDGLLRVAAFEGLKKFTSVCEICPPHLVNKPRFILNSLQTNESSILERASFLPSSFPFDHELYEEQKSIGTVDMAFQHPSSSSSSSSSSHQSPAPSASSTASFSPAIRSLTMGTQTIGLSGARKLIEPPEPGSMSARGPVMGVVGGTGLVGGTMGRAMGRSSSSSVPNVAGALSVAVGEEERGGGMFGCGEVENEKWVCILGEILRVLSVECRETCAGFHKIVVGKMETSFEHLLDVEKDKSADSSSHFYAWRNYLVAAVATCGAPLPGAEKPAQSLFKNILSLIKNETPRYAAGLCFSMEFLSPVVLNDVFLCLQPYIQETQKAKKIGSKKDSIRVHCANIVRLCAQALCSKLVDTNDEPLHSFMTHQCVQSTDKNAFKGRDELLQNLVLFQNDLFQFLQPHADSPAYCMNWTILSLKYCLFVILTAVIRGAFMTSKERHELVFYLDMRKDLFHFAQKFVGYGAASKTQKANEQKALEEMSAKLKSAEEKNALKTKMKESTQIIELAAGEAVRCLLLGRGFEDTLFEASGPLYELSSSLFHSQDSVMTELGRMSLLDFAESNQKQGSVAKVLVDKSYFVDPQISTNYFMCLADSIIRLSDMAYNLCSCLLLSIFKLGDPNAEVRRYAVRLVHYLCQKNFKNTGGYTYFVAPDINIEPSFVASISHLSYRLANDRPELTYSILDEVMQRSPAMDLTMQRRMLLLFTPWVSNIDFVAKPEKVKSVMTNLLVLTIKHGQERAEDAERMWKLLAGREGNVTHILDFLFNFGIISQSKEGLYYCKQVVLYLSRAAARPTINHLVSQLSSFDVRALGLEKVARGTAANPYSWVLSELVPPQAYQEPFSRCYFALAMLVNPSVEYGPACEPYLPKILHAIFLAGDRRNDQITSHALCLLHNICVALLSSQPNTEPLLTSLFEKIDTFHGKSSFWAYEGVTREKTKLKSAETLTSCVEFFVRLLDWKENLSEEWGREALNLAMSTDSVHLLSRSLQVYRALQPRVDANSLNHLLSRYKQYLVKKENVEVGLEIVCTLEEMVTWSPRETMTSIPQFFWSSVAFLLTNDPVEFNAATSLLSTVLSQIGDFGEGGMQGALLGVFPYDGWVPAYQGFLPFLIKGLTHPDTEITTLNLISEVASLPQGPIIDIDPKRGLLMNSVVLLPQLCLYMGKKDTSVVAKGLSGMFMDAQEQGYLVDQGMERCFSKYSAGDYETMELFVEQVSACIAATFFPQYELLVFSLLIELLDRGNFRLEKSLMALIDHLFSNVKIDTSLLQSKGMALFAPLELRLTGGEGGGEMGKRGVEKGVARSSLSITTRMVGSLPPGQIQVAHAKHMNVIQRLGDFLTTSPTWGAGVQETSRKATEKALEGVLKGGARGGVPEPIVVGEVGGRGGGGGWGGGGGIPPSLPQFSPPGMEGGGGGGGGGRGLAMYGVAPVLPPLEGYNNLEGGGGGGGMYDPSHENIVYDFDPGVNDYGQPPQYDNFDPPQMGYGGGIGGGGGEGVEFDPEKILEEYGE